MNGPAHWWFVGDLHLDPAEDEPRGLDDAFAGFVDQVVLACPSTGRNLVLLGDTFELRGASGPQEPGATIRETATSFPGVFDSLRRCLGSGVGVHFVCGNHDYALMTPAGRDEVCRLLTGGAAERTAAPEVHPWLLHRAGLFYAEHGNQHHELNRIPQLLLASRTGGVAQLSPTALEVWDRHRGRRPNLRGIGAVARAVLAAARSERAARSEAYGLLLTQLGGHELPGATLRSLHSVSTFRATGAIARTSRRMAGRLSGRTDHDSYLRQAAGRIDGLLRTGADRPLCYVFGHTHVEVVEELAEPGAWYANAGTWSRHVRHAGESLDRFPFVVVTDPGDAPPAVRLDYWDAAAGT